MNDAAGNPLAGDYQTELSVIGRPAGIGLLDALLTTIGEAFDRLSGSHASRLTAALTAGASTLELESTLHWPTSGVAAVGRRVVTYTGISGRTLTGLGWLAGRPEVFPPGTVVDDASRAFSALDLGRADMLPSKATGDRLSIVARSLVDIAKPWPMTDDTFRNLVQVLATVPRGTWLATWQVLEAALAEQHLSRTNGTTSSGAPARLSTATASTFKPWHVHRFVRIGTKVYRIVGVDTGSGQWADLATTGGPYWSAAAFGNATAVAFKVLAFRVEVSPASIGPAVVRVNVYAPASFGDVPPTYLQPSGAAATPVGEPLGGELVVDENTPGTGHQPLYISSGTAQIVVSLLSDVIPHGTSIETRLLLP